MKNEKISVILPTYKRPLRVVEAVESVLNQNNVDFELIIVDDNEPNTIEALQTQLSLEKYMLNPKVKYIKHIKNLNGAAARNTGIINSSGNYITFLDDDDLYLENKLLYQYENIKDNALSMGNYCGRIQHKEIIKPQFSGDLSECILSQTFSPTTPCLFFRREVFYEIGLFDESFKRHQDYEFLLRYFRKFKLDVVDKILVEIRTNNGENDIHGKELMKNKKNFLKIFENEIHSIDIHNRGFRKRVLLNHYVPVMFDHVSEIHIILALKVYLYLICLDIFKAHILIFKYITNYIKIRRRKYDS